MPAQDRHGTHCVCPGLTAVPLTRRTDRRTPKLEVENHRDLAAGAGNNQVFVERSFHCAGIRNAQHGVRGLDVVGDAEARFRLFGAGDAVVYIAAQPEVEGPIVSVMVS